MMEYDEVGVSCCRNVVFVSSRIQTFGMVHFQEIFGNNFKEIGHFWPIRNRPSLGGINKNLAPRFAGACSPLRHKLKHCYPVLNHAKTIVSFFLLGPT